jgi:hypothetical protein
MFVTAGTGRSIRRACPFEFFWPAVARGDEEAPPARRQWAEEYSDSAKPRRSATNLYIEELSERTRPYATPIAEARRIVDEATPSLTDALYELRREGRE